MFDIQYYKERFEQNNDIGTHASDKNNPHNVTKIQLELENVDNTSDENKPVSIAQQEAINSALSTSENYTDTKVANLVGSAPETLNTLEEVAQAIEENEDVVEALNHAIGVKANTSDLTNHITAKSNPHGVTKSQLGMGNVDNTSDKNKPISKATQAALDEITQAFKDYKCTIVKKSGETLSNYSESGVYYFGAGSNLTDVPVGANGFLVVISTYSYEEVDSGVSSGTVVRQFWLRSVSEENSYTDICTRNIRYYGKNDWTIGAWDRVYTENYGKENHYTKSETYTKTETANLIASKSYTKSEVNSLLNAKSNKLMWETVSKSNVVIAKNNYDTVTISAVKSGYNAAGIIGYNLTSTGATTASIYRAYVDADDKVQLGIRNGSDKDTSLTIQVTVLYVAD